MVVPVTVVDDTAHDPDETVVLYLQGAAGYQLGQPGNAHVTIADNDPAPPPPTITASNWHSAEEPSEDGQYRFVRTGDLTAAVTVTYTVAAISTATAGADYEGLDSYVVIPAGQASATITVAPFDAPWAEGPETVVAVLEADLVSRSARSAMPASHRPMPATTRGPQ